MGKKNLSNILECMGVMMIIFDLDGTLADCEHRRHLVDPTKSINYILQGYDEKGNMIEENNVYGHFTDGKRFKPDWKAFYEACDKDLPIDPVINIYNDLRYARNIHVEIWSGRCESVRKKTEQWLDLQDIYYDVLKMRPIGDNTPDDQLKERWLDEAIADGKIIDFVFDDRVKVVKMWRRRGVFVFDCNQFGKEF